MHKHIKPKKDILHSASQTNHQTARIHLRAALLYAFALQRYKGAVIEVQIPERNFSRDAVGIFFIVTLF